MARLKRCLVCGTENPPIAVFCDCGASLAGVPLIEPGPQAAPAVAAATPGPTPAGGETHPCPDPSCAHPNPPGSDRCALCFRPLAATSKGAKAALLRWPWGTQRLTGRLPLGRDPEFSPLTERLAAFPNLSRRHALLWVDQDGVWIQDLGSMNGTFLDNVRLESNRPQRLTAPARLRFGLVNALELDLDCTEE